MAVQKVSIGYINLLLLDKLAERKIEEHIASCDCAQNSFAGEALDLNIDALVPVQVRALYRVLKHNGYLPAEVVLRNEINSLNQLMHSITCVQERGYAAKRLQLLNTQLESQGRALSPKPIADYQQQLLERMHESSAGGSR